MWIYLQQPPSMKGRELGHNKIHFGYDIFNPPWLWGWNEVISETEKYWILEKSKERYVFIYKDTHKAHCLYGGKIYYYGNANEFSSEKPILINKFELLKDTRCEVESLNEQIRKLELEKAEMIKSTKVIIKED